MKITGAEIIIIQLPGRSSYTWRSLDVPIGRYAILRLETDDNLFGLGEAPAIMSWGGEHGRYFGEDPEVCADVMERYVMPRLRGMDPFEFKTFFAELDAGVRGFPYTKAMLESALFDLMGKSLGLPVYQLLGGAMRRKVQVCHSLGITSPEHAAEEALQVIEDGIQWLQIKVPGVPREDLAIVKAIREAVGERATFYPDVNRGYKDAKTAINSIKAMQAEAGIYAIEQPVEGGHLMAQIVASVDVPVIVDEGCWTPQDAMEIVRHRSADVISIYFTKAGGLHRSMEIGAIAHAAGLPVNVNGSLEGGVGNAANLHLSAALEDTLLPGVVTVTTLAGREQTKVGGVFYTDDIITEPFDYADGALIVPDRPGMGVELDEEKVKKYQIDKRRLGA